MGADSFPNGGIGTLRFQGETNAKSPPDTSSVTQVPGLVCGASLIPARPRSSVIADELAPSAPTLMLRTGVFLRSRTLTHRIPGSACAATAARKPRQTRLNMRMSWFMAITLFIVSAASGLMRATAIQLNFCNGRVRIFPTFVHFHYLEPESCFLLRL